MARLYVLSGDDIGRTYDLSGPVVLGRSKAADVVLRHPTVGREHARMSPVEGGWSIEDLGSRNGLQVDGARVQRALLGDGQVFVVGGLELRLRLSTPEEEEALRAAVRAAVPVARVEPDPPAPAPAPAPEPEPEPEPVTESAPPQVEDELSLEGDWDDGARGGSLPVARPAAPAPAPRKTPAPAQSEAQRQRVAAMAPPGGERRTDSGGRLLQYSRHEGSSAGLLRGDLSQQPFAVRAAVTIGALLLFAGLVYAAFVLTRGLRAGNRAVTIEELAE